MVVVKCGQRGCWLIEATATCIKTILNVLFLHKNFRPSRFSFALEII